MNKTPKDVREQRKGKVTVQYKACVGKTVMNGVEIFRTRCNSVASPPKKSLFFPILLIPNESHDKAAPTFYVLYLWPFTLKR